MNLIRRRSLQTIAEIGDLRDYIVNLSKEKLTSKQFHLGTAFNPDNYETVELTLFISF